MIVYHAVLLGLLVGTTGLATGLSVLNVRHGAREMRANRDWLADRLGIDDPEEVIDYERARTRLGLLRSWLFLLVLLGALYIDAVTAIVRFLSETGLPVVVQGVVFFGGLLVVQRIASVPFDFYSTFVIDEQFGFNESTPLLWVRDFLLGVAITLVLSGLFLGALLVFIESLGPWQWVGAGWVLVVAFMLLGQIIYPRVIAPLFNEFERVEEGPLRDSVESVFDRAGFEASEIYTMDQSRRSSRLNAYFIGFGQAKRVVLFDTLVEKLDDAEIESVLAHELAHWKKGHVWKRIGAATVQSGIVLAVLGYLLSTEWLYSLFEMPETSYAGLFVSLLFVYPVVELSSPLVNKLSLAHEREADSFAVEVMGNDEPVASGLAKLARENLANPFPHPWYAAFNHQHPPIPERIQYVKEQATTDSESGKETSTA